MSAPVSRSAAVAWIVVGVPKTDDAKETGYTPRSSSAPPPSSRLFMRCAGSSESSWV